MDDLVMLKTNFSRDPEQERKTEILKHVGITTQTVHYLRHDSIPTPLLVTMRVMAMNPMEIDHCFQLIQQQEQQHQVEEQEMEQEEELENRLEQTERAIAMALKQELEFLGLRNEFAMLDLLDMLLGVKLQGILEWDDKLDKPQNQAQEFARIYRQGQSQVLQACEDICRGMFSVLLHESSSATLSLAQAVFLDTSGEREQQLEQTAQNRVLSGLERRIESPETYDTPYFKAKAQEEIRTMSELKRDAVQQVLLTARGVMMEHRDGVFGEALGSAFPEHGWGDETWVEEDQDEEEEMAIQMEQDAILTCFLVFENQRPVRFCNYITAAKKMDYSSLLEEDMKEDVEDLRQSLQEPLEAVNPEAFNFSKTFTRKAFVWATGILEALSLSLHIDGEVVTGVLAPRDVTAMESGRTKRKHE
ncbi:hypothetical protein BC939DRAFT_288255 [Gamsiella multidivaricata]|uniref:uncharacterized protein n=1 Tax=Gamsiella multidivaricata TaxID=101098 RepID=UPI00221F4F88|nr:uncharacterized protein BC939DRAFT_288255 [Gamsiella multidivaricata]KAI7818648.1 hypothetical protein BC939DRAFT_288255 [Gamsiella multidivaricata]